MHYRFHWFWWDNIWLPGNVTWANFEDRNGYIFPKPYQLCASIPYGPFWCHNSLLPLQAEMRLLAKKINWTVHLVEKWFRRRRNIEIPTVSQKFRESLLPSQYWYYMAEIGFYWSLLFTLGFDTKRKDFKAHVVHHLAAISLMASSWCGNYTRIGTLVMIVNDSADFWLEAAKIFNYAGWEDTCGMLFIIFTVVFFITRIILLPFCILRATLYQPTCYYFQPVVAYFFFNGQLLVLQGLHVYWFSLVLKILKKFIFIKVSEQEKQERVREGTEEERRARAGVRREIRSKR
uniref:Ceramide synthase 3 n=1 Tax=Sphenodon punctatus TaxID=8508 RepID=A0A8D0H0Z5_SPHPU